MRLVSFRGLPLNSGGLVSAFDRSFQRPALSPVTVRRQGRAPMVTAVEEEPWQLPTLGMLIESGEEGALRSAVLRAFDTRAGAGALIVSDDDGDNERYIYAVCQNLEQEKGAGGLGFAATLVAAFEPYWTAVEPTIGTLSGATGTLIVNNPGDVEVEPVLQFGSVTKSGTSHYLYRRFVAVEWNAHRAASNYPVELTDGSGLNTAALISGLKLTDQTGFAVIVNGQEVDRWFGAANGQPGGFASATTRVWINLDFEHALTATLAATIPAVEFIDEIAVNEDISAWPAAGIIQIDAERFAYTGRDTYRRVFTGVGRAAYDTSGESHAIGAGVQWLQHAVWIAYTRGQNVTTHTTDDARKPLLDLGASNNQSWVWSGFGSAAQPERPAQWTPVVNGTAGIFTGAQGGAPTDPFEVMGLAVPELGARQPENFGRWQVYLPAGLLGYTIDGDSYEGSSMAYIELSPDGATWTRADETTNGGPAAWDGWQETASGLDGDDAYLAVRAALLAPGHDIQVQVTGVTASLHQATRPTTAVGGERGNYQMQMTVENETTSQTLFITPLPGMRPDDSEYLVVDTTARTAVSNATGISYYDAVRRDAMRAALLTLAPGSNTLKFTEPNATEFSIVVTFWPRWYV